MALPTINTPTYELEVPSTDEKIKYRPFLVKEEKILLIAMESGKTEDIINAVKDIVSACTFEKLELGNMPMFDIEYIFLQIRAKSVGEVSNLRLLCPDDKETYAEVEVDLSKVMKYPSIDSFTDTGITDVTASNMLEVVTTCIDHIYDKKGKEVFSAKDQTKKELTDFIEQLNTKQFKDVQKFFDTMPKLKHVVTIENPKTKVKTDVVLQGLNDFFE
jgi:hypothetical protein